MTHPPNHLAVELRHILDDLHDSEHGDVPTYLVRERLLRLAEHVERLGAQPVEVDASTELTAHFGLEPEQQSRSDAAQAIGWQHPSDTDLPDYHAWWWAELDRLADWIADGTRPEPEPEPDLPCNCIPSLRQPNVWDGTRCPRHNPMVRGQARP